MFTVNITAVLKGKEINPRYNTGDFCCLKQMAAQKTRHVHGEHENCERRKGVGGVGQVQGRALRLHR